MFDGGKAGDREGGRDKQHDLLRSRVGGVIDGGADVGM